MLDSDTIAAIATAPGKGGIGIVRISGAQAKTIGAAICGKNLSPRLAEFCHFKDATGKTFDHGVALYFSGPASFTGEDIVELQGHGGPVILDMLLESCISLGARAAEPGEFSKRAFLNDKIDLAQAEAIADLIDASSRQAATSALRSLQGEFSNAISVIAHDLLKLRMYVESAIDFPEEEIDFLNDGVVRNKLLHIKQALETLLANADQGSLLRDGIHIALAGAPNAGKSSLLNALAGQETAIVSDIAGTTRDIVKESIHIDGIPIHISDTAGIRQTDDRVEKIGIDRSLKAASQSDLLLLVIDGSNGDIVLEQQKLLAQLPEYDTKPTLIINNKVDISGDAIATAGNIINLSAKTGAGLDLLKQAIKTTVNATQHAETTILARRRHIDALKSCLQLLSQAEHQLTMFSAGELAAEDLKSAHNALGSITGKVSADDLLGEIFSNFCIGK